MDGIRASGMCLRPLHMLILQRAIEDSPNPAQTQPSTDGTTGPGGFGRPHHITRVVRFLTAAEAYFTIDSAILVGARVTSRAA